MKKIIIALIAIFAISAICKRQERINMNNAITDYDYYPVEQGDTLWCIASERCPDTIDIRKYIYTVIELNEIDNTIHPGDFLKIPVYGNAKRD